MAAPGWMTRLRKSREAAAPIVGNAAPALRDAEGPSREAPLAADALEAVLDAARAEFVEGRTFYVTGAGRSGTTSCIRILGTAENAETFSEPAPRFTEEVRLHALGRLIDPRPLVWKGRVARMREVVGSGRIYGEKDQQVFAWLPFYRDLFLGRFLHVRRDGRAVVRSLMDYHYRINGNMYRDVADDEKLTDHARQRQAELPEYAKMTDRVRPRPRPGEPFFDRWPSLTRLQMIAWYWSHTARTAQRDLQRMPRDAWTSIDYTREATPDAFRRIFDFFGLEGFDEATVAEMLGARIGRIEDVARHDIDRFPRPENWADATTREFDEVAASAMVELGYYPFTRLPLACDAGTLDTFELPAGDPLPGCWWREHAEGHAERGGSVLIVGDAAGPGAGPVEVVSGGRIGQIPAGRRDVVAAVGVIDRVPEMDGFLRLLADRAAERLIVLASRGHFDGHLDHRYRSCGGGFRNEWSVAKAHSLLAGALGFRHVVSGAWATGDALRPELSVIVASRTDPPLALEGSTP